jgi:hypothetical protein
LVLDFLGSTLSSLTAGKLHRGVGNLLGGATVNGGHPKQCPVRIVDETKNTIAQPVFAAVNEFDSAALTRLLAK